MRAFLAIPLRGSALAEAQEVLTQLRDHVPAVRWARPETLHVTLHFFGQLSDVDAERALAAIRPAVTRTPAIELTLDRLGAFPSRGAPRVLWLGASGESIELSKLAVACGEALREADFSVDARPFRAHCTLGRPRTRWSQSAHDEWRRIRAAPLTPIAFAATQLTLFESVHAEGGNRYLERVVVPLGA